MAGGAEDLLVRGVTRPDWETTAKVGDGRIATGSPIDVRIENGRVAAVGRSLEGRDEAVLDAQGAVVLPGLHDHHLHLRALLAVERSARVGPDHVHGVERLGAALRQAPVDRHGWRRAVGYHESVAGELDRRALDTLAPGPPMRVQHRSGAMWMLSSSAVEALELDREDAEGVERDDSGRPTGRLFRMDDWLARRLLDDDPIEQVGGVSARLAARGVTGMTDATPGATEAGVAALARAVVEDRLLQRLHLMAGPEQRIEPHDLVTHGPLKVLLDDDRLPALDDLAAVVDRAHVAGVPVAVHCVTTAQLVLAVAALQIAGPAPGDRVEHGSVIPSELVPELAALGVVVVTNPAFVETRGDSYLDEVDDRDLADLYRCASLRAGGVAVAAGTDAPFGPWDPWIAVRAAATRRTSGGRVVGASEAVALRDAVELFTGRADEPGRSRRIAVGEVGDLCMLVDGMMPVGGQADAVFATVVAGRVVHGPG